MDRYTFNLRKSMPLEDKVKFSKARIKEWVDHFGIDGCYISFSGGKDSTVLLHLVRSMYPDIEAVFVDTGLEFPEVRKFVNTFPNITILRPDMRFDKVLEKYGYPIISKEISECISQAKKCKECGKYTYRLQRALGEAKDKNGNKSKYNCEKWKDLLDAPFDISNQCCNVMKKKPAHKFYKDTGKVPFIATLAEESRLREQQYLKNGCNAFNNKIPTSTPIAFWTEQDILRYISENNLAICKVYGDVLVDDKGYILTGYQRTGCMFCGFGCHLEEEPNRFQKLKKTHPAQYNYIINDLGMGRVLDYIGVRY